MKNRKTIHCSVGNLAALLLAGIGLLVGCGRNSSPAANPRPVARQNMESASTHPVAGQSTNVPAAQASVTNPSEQKRSSDDPSPLVRPVAPPSQRMSPPPRSLQDLVTQSAETPAEDVRPAVNDETLAAAGIRRIAGRHLILLTDVPPHPAVDELPAVFDSAISGWCAYFQVKPDRAAEWRVIGHLMKDKSRFQRLGLLPESLPPFLNGYQLGHNLWLYDQETDYYRRHLLLHEGTHGFMERFLGGGGPPWYKEGMAELLATHDWEDGVVRLAQFPNDREDTPGWGRIKMVRDEYAAGRALALDQIMRYGSHAHLQNEAYGWSWAACAFLDWHPRYRDRFRRLQSDAGDASIDFSLRFQRSLAADWPLLNHEWHAFVANLDYGYDSVREAIEPRPSVSLEASGTEIAIDADRGWQSTGINLEKGKSYAIAASGRFQINDQPEAWWSEANGVTIHYHHGMPLGVLLAAVIDDQEMPREVSALAHPQMVGLRGVIHAESNGVLYLRVNDSSASLANNAGRVMVRVSFRGP